MMCCSPIKALKELCIVFWLHCGCQRWSVAILAVVQMSIINSFHLSTIYMRQVYFFSGAACVSEAWNSLVIVYKCLCLCWKCTNILLIYNIQEIQTQTSFQCIFRMLVKQKKMLAKQLETVLETRLLKNRLFEGHLPREDIGTATKTQLSLGTTGTWYSHIKWTSGVNLAALI